MSVMQVTGLAYDVQPHFWSRRKRILHDVSFTVEQGEIFGFLGPNGAGKTTTIKSILGLLRPQRGEVRIFGGDPHTAVGRKRLGFLPERAYFPEHLTGKEVIYQHGLLAGLSLAETRRRAGELLELVGVAHAADQRLGSYSKGMLQRVGLAQAIVGDPELVILDEPMSGLDPLGRHDVRQLMLELRRRGKTVFFSTHILPDVEMICDRVAIVVQGRVTKQGSLGELIASAASRFEITATACPPEALDAARSVGARVEQRPAGIAFEATDSAGANAILDVLRRHDVAITQLQAHRDSLEELFLREARGGGAT